MPVSPLFKADMEVIQELDFEAELPCEATEEWHGRFGTGPAVWILITVCPNCSLKEQSLFCDGCWKTIYSAASRVRSHVKCMQCNYEGPLSSWKWTVRPIK